MSNYQTFKNTIKKLEAKQLDRDNYPYSGVICVEDYEKLVLPEEPEGHRSKVGFLVVPRRLTEEEWVSKHCL